jgi:nicotinamidase-related amidase
MIVAVNGIEIEPRSPMRTKLTKWIGCTFESNPDLADQLRAQGVHTVVICGIQTEWCVRATSLGALRAQFNVVLLQGAHSTYNDPETGKSATQWEHDVEEELQSVKTKPEVKLSLTPWGEWKPTNIY